MKTKISRLAAHILIMAWVVEDRKTETAQLPEWDTPYLEAWNYLQSREEGFPDPFDLDMGGLQLAYNQQEQSWYLQEDPHAGAEEAFLRRFKESMRPSWA